MRSLLPGSATVDARRLVTARSLRGFADGFVSVALASYLRDIGFSPIEVGAIVTSTLLGSAALTLVVGFWASGVPQRTVLIIATGLMAFTGFGFAGITEFWPLLVVAFAGTLNPSGGDVSVFLPVEQSLLTGAVADRDRTALFARYNLGAIFAAALGALCSGLPVFFANRAEIDVTEAQRIAFALYGVLALGLTLLYLGLQQPEGLRRRAAPLKESRRIVLRLSALFSLDSLGGGLVVQSLLALWLFERFDLSVGATGTIFFAAGLCSAFSQLVAAWLARRIGLIRTMVYTHLPANLFLILAALMPNVGLAVAFLLARMALSQMDVPARQSYVMAVVPPEERVTAASVTNVPRSLAAATTPLVAGLMLNATSFGWPLIAAGLIKATYDLLLLWQFQSVRPPEELVA
ncbi:MAG: MFS transporter [Dehalococcoidia bacterium]|nr:MFS transporter [Dehalococcoidia bacterium]